MRGLLLAALAGRLPLGRFESSSSVCSLHSVRLHAVSLGHPVVGECTYTSASRSFAPLPEVPLSSSLRQTLLSLHTQHLQGLASNTLLEHQQQEQHQQWEQQQQQQQWEQQQQQEEEEGEVVLEPLMLMPWSIRGNWRDLYKWGRLNPSSSAAAAAGATAAAATSAPAAGAVWRVYRDSLSPLLGLPPLQSNQQEILFASTASKATGLLMSSHEKEAEAACSDGHCSHSSNSSSSSSSSSSNSSSSSSGNASAPGACECWQAACASSPRVSLWRHFQ
ncbi:hypothetical protein Emed_000109 [Eimeria media]